MKLYIDSANLDQIKKYDQIYQLAGVTSNPSILKKEGKIDFFDHLREIRKIIGKERKLFVQVTANDVKGMLKDAMHIVRMLDDEVIIKIPTTETGLAAIKILEQEGIHTLATAVYTKQQCFAAIINGAEYIAPYCNRIQSSGGDYMDVISATRTMIDMYDKDVEIIGASFHFVEQITNAFEAGAQAVTVSPDMLHEMMVNNDVDQIVNKFECDWKEMQDNKAITELF